MMEQMVRVCFLDPESLPRHLDLAIPPLKVSRDPAQQKATVGARLCLMRHVVDSNARWQLRTAVVALTLPSTAT